jgi:hypothetical protein
MRQGVRRAGTAGVLVGAAGAALGWAANDYRRWRALGPTGVPANPVGWLVVGGLRLRARDPLRWRDPGTGDVSRGLVQLDPRLGDRPAVDPHPLPHRVLDQQADPTTLAALREVVERFGERPELETRPSAHSPGRTAVALRGGAELAHLHPEDGSLHVALSPLDARVVVARRWGEFHPLAGVARGLPEGWVLLYPPRDAAAAERIGTILAAAVDFGIDPTPTPAAPESEQVPLGLPGLRRRD